MRLAYEEQQLMAKYNNHMQGIILVVVGMFVFSFQNIAIKWINGGYPVLQIVIIRSLVALPLAVLFFRMEGHRGLPSTTQRRLEYTRGLLLFLSYNTYFMGVASLPLAEVATIRFSAPLTITLLSVVMLGEKVGPRRWGALVVGFLGVLLIMRPGTTSFNLGSVFVAVATITYSLSLMLTRRLRNYDSSATMAYYCTAVYLVMAIALAPLASLVGEMPDAHPSIAFLFRQWAVPTPIDLLIMAGLGGIWATGMFLVARAYSLAPASVAAPFEYTALPINVMWGMLFWNEIPTWATWAGAGLTLGAGVYILLRESQLRESKVAVEIGD